MNKNLKEVSLCRHTAEEHSRLKVRHVPRPARGVWLASSRSGQEAGVNLRGERGTRRSGRAERSGAGGPTGSPDFTQKEMGAARGFEKGRKVSTIPCIYNQGNRAVEMVDNLPTRASGRAGI